MKVILKQILRQNQEQGYEATEMATQSSEKIKHPLVWKIFLRPRTKWQQGNQLFKVGGAQPTKSRIPILISMLY